MRRLSSRVGASERDVPGTVGIWARLEGGGTGCPPDGLEQDVPATVGKLARTGMDSRPWVR